MGEEVGRSREGRPVRAFRFGRGERRVSLLAGCHADEPVGPRLLRHLCGCLADRSPDDPVLARWEWWVVPHINPDGEARNEPWQRDAGGAYDLPAYLCRVVRESPGDDVEFGFPRDPWDDGARPENRAVHRWWRGAGGPFHLHASLHGLAVGAGPWFLVEPAWRDRIGRLKARCAARARELGYRLHDVDRRGEKGFWRLERGFATRPSSRAMREHFLGRGDPETAKRFRPSSMEAIRALGGDPLTLVAELPLFLTPGVGDTLGPPDPVAERWRRRLEGWRERLRSTGCGGPEFEDAAREVRAEAEGSGLRPMPLRDQMDLQWTLIRAGLEQAEREGPAQPEGGGPSPEGDEPSSERDGPRPQENGHRREMSR